MGIWDGSGIPELGATPAAGDGILVRDVSDNGTIAAGVIKEVTYAQFTDGLGGGSSADGAADIARLMIFGHSYTAGYLNTEGGERWATRLAVMLHAEEVTYAQSGGILAADVANGNSGGYPNVLNALTPRAGASGVYSPRNAAPYMPLSPVVVIDYGFNDLAWLNATTATAVAWFKAALRACVCIARAGGWFPDTDSSVAYSSGWSANTGVEGYGAPTNHTATATGKTVTITVPADFPGGEIDLLTLPFGAGTKWSTVVDGGSAQLLDGTSSAFGPYGPGGSNLAVQRLTGLAAGAHTIVMTVSALDSGATACFQGWLIAGPSVPLTVLVNHPDCPCLPLTAGGAPHTPVTSSDVTALNTAISALVAEFADGNVVLADIAAAFAAAGGNVASTAPGSLYVSDSLHPNAAGHALIAATVRDAIRSAPAPTVARACPAGRIERQVGGPLEPQLASGWTVTSSDPAWFCKDGSGIVTVTLALTKGSAGSFGETIFTLPPGYWPANNVAMFGLSWNSGFTAVVLAALGITPAGEVQWYQGDPTTALTVQWSYLADGPGA